MRLAVVVLVLLGLSSLVRPSSPSSSPSPSAVFPTGHGIVKTRLMIMILSHAGDNRRDSLRETWLTGGANETQWVFVLGNINESPNKEQVLIEQKVHGDMIFLDDVKDDYQHLSDKTLRGFQEIYNHYEFDFLLKIDTDTFIILPRLLEFLQGITPVKRYIGSFAVTEREEELWFGSLKRASYMLGGGYILSRDLIAFFAHFQHLMLRSPSEDVTVGVHLNTLELDYVRMNDTVFKSAQSFCECDSNVMLNHKCKRSDMFYMYYSYEATGNSCEYLTDPVLAQGIKEQHNVPVDEVVVR